MSSTCKPFASSPTRLIETETQTAYLTEHMKWAINRGQKNQMTKMLLPTEELGFRLSGRKIELTAGGASSWVKTISLNYELCSLPFHEADTFGRNRKSYNWYLSWLACEKLNERNRSQSYQLVDSVPNLWLRGSFPYNYRNELPS